MLLVSREIIDVNLGCWGTPDLNLFDQVSAQSTPFLKPLHRPPKVVKSFVERMNKSILRKDEHLKNSPPLDHNEEGDEDHPLKLRVRALMQQRRHAGLVHQLNGKVMFCSCS